MNTNENFDHSITNLALTVFNIHTIKCCLCELKTQVMDANHTQKIQFIGTEEDMLKLCSRLVDR